MRRSDDKSRSAGRRGFLQGFVSAAGVSLMGHDALARWERRRRKGAPGGIFFRRVRREETDRDDPYSLQTAKSADP